MKIIYKLIIALLLIIFSLFFLDFGLDYYEKTQVKTEAYEILKQIENGKYEEALNKFHLNNSIREKLKKESLINLMSMLRSTTWEIEYVKLTPPAGDALVLLYLNEEPGSIPGRFDYLLMSNLDGEWKVLLDPNSMVGRELQLQ